MASRLGSCIALNLVRYRCQSSTPPSTRQSAITVNSPAVNPPMLSAHRVITAQLNAKRIWTLHGVGTSVTLKFGLLRWSHSGERIQLVFSLVCANQKLHARPSTTSTHYRLRSHQDLYHDETRGSNARPVLRRRRLQQVNWYTKAHEGRRAGFTA